MHVIRRRAGRALLLGVVMSHAAIAPVSAADSETPPPAADAAAATPAPESADAAKSECLSHYERAQVARRERRLLDARSALRACSAAACPSAIRADCVDWLDQLAHSVPSVVVTARARGVDILAVKVFVDGKVATERLTGFALEIDPGLHKFRFESPPWPPIEREVLASEGVKDRHIDLEFAPPLHPSVALGAQAEPAKPFRFERSDYVFGGIALAGFATLGYFGGTGLQDAHHLDSTCMPLCASSDVDSVRTKLIVADVGLAVGLVALAAALYLHGKGAF